jgi:hypothetical protein
MYAILSSYVQNDHRLRHGIEPNHLQSFPYTDGIIVLWSLPSSILLVVNQEVPQAVPVVALDIDVVHTAP